jgi:hypothetical protein
LEQPAFESVPAQQVSATAAVSEPCATYTIVELQPRQDVSEQYNIGTAPDPHSAPVDEQARGAASPAAAVSGVFDLSCQGDDCSSQLEEDARTNTTR